MPMLISPDATVLIAVYQALLSLSKGPTPDVRSLLLVVGKPVFHTVLQRLSTWLPMRGSSAMASRMLLCGRP
eukprot:12884421-Prorocentrum_lima.AAC.1